MRARRNVSLARDDSRRRRARMRRETTFMRFRDSERRIDAIESARATDEDERRPIA